MIPVYQDLIPKGRRNRPGIKLQARYITIHDTANSNKGADAKAHAAYLKSDTAANAPVSWHFTVDDKQAIQHIPLDEVAWHAGDGMGPGNTASIGIEICENPDGDRAKGEENAAWLVAYLLSMPEFEHIDLVDGIKPHQYWTNTNCPHILITRWDDFIADIRRHLRSKSITPIQGRSQATIETMQAWARARNATQDFVRLAPVYWEEAHRRGIRADIAYAQSAKETAFGRFGGTVTREHHNWCGLKTREGGADNDPNAHARFPDDRTGVIAHIQHLCAYAGVQLDEEIVDPRYVWVKPGSAITVELLGGKWAPNPNYGISIRDDYLLPMLTTEEPPPQEQEDIKAVLSELEKRVLKVETILARISQVFENP